MIARINLAAAALAAAFAYPVSSAASLPRRGAETYTISPAVVTAPAGPWQKTVFYTNDSGQSLLVSPAIFARSGSRLARLPRNQPYIHISPAVQGVAPGQTASFRLAGNVPADASRTKWLVVAFLARVAHPQPFSPPRAIGAPAATVALGRPLASTHLAPALSGPVFVGSGRRTKLSLRVVLRGDGWAIPRAHVSVWSLGWPPTGSSRAMTLPVALSHAPSRARVKVNLPLFGLTHVTATVGGHLAGLWIVSWPVAPTLVGLGTFAAVQIAAAARARRRRS